MGDRANVFVKEDTSGEGVFLYTHWGGRDLPKLVQEVLSLRERWSDPSYLARMIFSRMIKGEERGTTGYGISQKVGDGEDRVIKVDTVKQEVTIGGKTWGFEKFL